MGSAVAAKSRTVTLDFEKDTKNTQRFAEVADEDGNEPMIGTLYVPKSTLAELGNPTSIEVTISPAS